MRLLVTGSRHGRADVEWYLDAFLAKHGKPALFVCGDAEGVDLQAYTWALHHLGRGTIKRELVKPRMPSPQRYHERDQRMADHVGPGDWALGFPIEGSRGTHLTLRMSRERGARAVVCELRSNR